MKTDNINLTDYDYLLPPDRIARYPANERDLSRLLVFKDNIISKDIFRNIGQHLPHDSLLVFNNTRVITARILFRKETGAVIEVLCLEPLNPAEYESSLSSEGPVEWKCIIGNLKKWKSGTIKASYFRSGTEYEIFAKRVKQEGDAWRVRFEWNSEGTTFGEVIELAGILPLPPYLEREAEPEDLKRYQTVYSRIKGSVAAPTAGLHFTEQMVRNLKASGMHSTEITLHVGAGTFKPIKSKSISDHEMHYEHFSVSRETVRLLREFKGRIIPVGTTSVRTLESLYWLGVKLINKSPGGSEELSLGQWDPYEAESDIPVDESIDAILRYMNEKKLQVIHASTGIIIIPGYEFRMISGIITNFHQPMSTLLLLISAWVKESWKDIYKYALENDFRFLSYGDSSLLFRRQNDF
ncbi:MAG: S-adenosylmethionine:tRNA ribosyltransferase-isomerase [Bacteroidales bacterium]|nr:S-adenosylmethionine:tRNA ribosyltransferase-isomerase [Bacteroidales bacterium]